MSTKKKPVEYVNNKEFYTAIVEYRQKLNYARENNLPEPKIPDYIGECIMKIAQRLSTKPCFLSYSFRSEMVSDAIENSFLYFHDYDPDYNPNNDPDYKPNPFSYFSQLAFFAFLRRIAKEERIRYTLYKSFQQSIIDSGLDHSLFVDADDNNIMPKQMYANINDFMKRFEDKEEQKKLKRKQKKQGLRGFYNEV